MPNKILPSKTLNLVTYDRCCEILSELVKIESVNPFESGGKTEDDIARHLANRLRRLDLQVEEQTVAKGRFNPVGLLEGEKGGPTIMLNSHMDTVGVEGMKEPFKPTIVGDELYGRGSCDAKGSLSSMSMAIEAIAKSEMKISGKVIFAPVCDEEYKSTGTDRLVDKYRADYAVVGEPTELRLGIAHKGFVWVKLVTKGKAAHGSVPEEGIDAIEKMAQLITGLKELRHDYGHRELHPLLGEPKLHMGTIAGGTAPSVVPGLCEMIVERRTLPGETTEQILKEVRQVVSKASRNDPSLKVEISVPFERTPFEVRLDDPFVSKLENAYETALGKKAVICGLPYWTDAAIISNRLKIPTCVFGPGDIRYAHSRDEHIRIGEVVEAAKVYLTLIASMCSGE